MARLAVLAVLATLARPGCAAGAFDLRAVEPRELGCGTILGLGPWGLAGLAGPAGVSCAAREVAVYGFRPFGVRGVEVVAASCRIGFESPLRRLDFGYQRLGALGYCEEVWLASATLAVRSFRVSPAVRLALASLDDRAGDWALLADCRGSAEVAGLVWVGVCLENPFGLGLKRGGERAPTTVRVSVALAATERITFGIDLAKSNGFATCLGSGVEWRPARALQVRAGVRTFPREIALGIGCGGDRVGIDLATVFNADLGATHEAGARFRW